MSLMVSNGVTLPYPLTTAFNQEAVYDDTPGGVPTDRILTKFDITVQTIINASYLALIAPDLVQAGEAVTQNPADIMQIVRGRLMQPRKALSFSINGKELLPKRLAGNKGAVDAKNGPMPQSCNITELTNSTFLVTYHIVAHYWEDNIKQISDGELIGITNFPTGPILSNRWVETVELDNCQMSTRTREGKFTIRSDNPQGLIADQMREQMAVVSVPEGFLRASSRYSLSTDGLSLSYSIVDKETYKMPPKPAFEAEGTYTESCSNLGAMRYAEVQVKLKGDNSLKQGNDTQGALVRACFTIVFGKLKSQGAGVLNIKIGGNMLKNSNLGILQSFQIRVWMYENIVESHARVLFKSNKKLLFNSPSPSSIITFTPLSDLEKYTPNYQSRGTAYLLLQAAKYYDPSANGGGVQLGPGKGTLAGEGVQIGNKAEQMPQGKMPGQEGKDGP